MVYAGETNRLLTRLGDHGRGDAATYKQIRLAIRHGKRVYFRYMRCSSKEAAYNAQQRRVINWRGYPWNLKLR